MKHSDPRTSASLLADTTDETSVEAAEVVVKAAEAQLSPITLGRMLVSAGRSITDENDLLTVLQRVTEIAQQAIDGADSTGVTIDLGGRIYTAVHTDDRTLRVDTEQYNAGDGPCLEASRTGTIVLVDAGDAAHRWPRFAAAAQDVGLPAVAW